MSLFLDQKYLMLVSNRLPLFKKKDDRLYNCRCILCGDSAKKKNKARGYFFPYKADLVYKCHNCDASMSFSTFLKRLDTHIFNQYSLEKYTEGQSLSNISNVVKFEEPVFKTAETRLLDKILDRLDTLDEDNEAVQFCIARKIPRSKFNQMYYIPNIKDIVQLNDKYKQSIQGEEPRLVIPFYDSNNQLTGVTCRALRGEALRYITVKVKESDLLVFGANSVDKNKTVYVVEGPLDSLFVENCIAVSGVGLIKATALGIEERNLVMVFDNQPRNKEVCKVIERTIDQGYNVVIWPQTLEQKDINDMVIAGHDVNRICKNNTFTGLSAKAKFIAWKRC